MHTSIRKDNTPSGVESINKYIGDRIHLSMLRSKITKKHLLMQLKTSNAILRRVLKGEMVNFGTLMLVMKEIQDYEISKGYPITNWENVLKECWGNVCSNTYCQQNEK